MMVRFSPASEFSDNPVLAASASMSPGRSTVSREGRGSASNAPPAPNPVRSMKRFSIASKRFLIAARSAFESGKLAQSLFDVFALSFVALFVALIVGAVGWSFFILGSAALK